MPEPEEEDKNFKYRKKVKMREQVRHRRLDIDEPLLSASDLPYRDRFEKTEYKNNTYIKTSVLLCSIKSKRDWHIRKNFKKSSSRKPIEFATETNPTCTESRYGEKKDKTYLPHKKPPITCCTHRRPRLVACLSDDTCLSEDSVQRFDEGESTQPSANESSERSFELLMESRALMQTPEMEGVRELVLKWTTLKKSEFSRFH
jgi:hypothetical protein